MKVYSEKFLRNYLKTFYPNLKQLRKILLIKNTNLNSLNYVVYSKSGKFLLKNFSTKFNTSRITKISKISNYCNQHNSKTPLIILNKNSRLVDSKNKFLLSNYVNGILFNGNSKQLVNLSKEIAKLHKILKNNPSHLSNPKNNNAYRLLSENEINKISSYTKNKHSKFDKLASKNLNFILTNIENCNLIFKSEKKLQKINQLIHHDLHPKNVLFNNYQVSGILDLNDLQKGSPLEDVGFISFRFPIFRTRDKSKLKNQVKITINTYLENSNLPKIEFTHIFNEFNMEMLRRMSYILRRRYFQKDTLWSNDFSKLLSIFKIAFEVQKKF